MNDGRQLLREKYEGESFIRFIFNWIVTRLLINIPEKMQDTFLSTSKQAIDVKENATTYRAMEILYTYNKDHNQRNLWSRKGVSDRIWFNLKNSKAIRNRLVLVEYILSNIIQEEISKQIHIYSLGCGSARAVLETIKKYHERQIKSTLIDINYNALKYANDLSSSFNLNAKFAWVQDKAENFYQYVNNGNFIIIEMVGLLDYFDDEKLILICNKIFSTLRKDEYAIFGNIRINNESEFLNKVIKWPLIYREPSQFENLIKLSGFSKIEIVYEPLGVHGIVIAQK